MSEIKAFVNGKIFTSDDSNPYAEAMIVEDGLIRWIGKKDEIPYTDLPVTVIDLQAKRVLPGFVDAHMHVGMLAEQSLQISCLPPAVSSIDDLVASIKSVRSRQKAGDWITGWGYDEGKIADNRLPDRHDLDAACSDAPVCIIRTCEHIRCVNSRALQMAGIARDTPDPQGGMIERDEDGEPTGILRENARNLVSEIMPELTDDEMTACLVRTGKLLASQGITAVTDMGSLEGKDHYNCLLRAAADGFRQQTAVYYIWDYFKDDPEFVIDADRSRSDAQIRIAGLKLIGDGSVSGRTAWMDEPYKGSNDEYGMPVYSDDLIDSAIEFCRKTRCQLSVHAMGARAIKRAVDRLCEEIPWTYEGIPFARVEHITEPLEESIAKAAHSGIMFVTQPDFLYAEIESYIKNLGKERLRRAYPVKHMLDRGVKLAFSTDAPATAWSEPSDPMPCLKFAVTRKSYDGTDCGADEAVDIETAVKLYTRCSAEAAGFSKTGQLKAGYRADFIVFDKDIFEMDPDDLDKVSVQQTYIKGECVYEKII